MVITICGSNKFKDDVLKWNKALTFAGHSVFTCGSFAFDNDTEQSFKPIVDLVHLNKIAISDAIVVINKFAYIGESTLQEILYSKLNNKKAYYLESWGVGCGIGFDHFDAVRAECKNVTGEFSSHSIIDTSKNPSPYDLIPIDIDPEQRRYIVSLIS